MIIGMTGGVGSGKSTAVDYIGEYYQAYILKTDEVAHDVMKDKEVLSLLEEAFSAPITNGCGELDKGVYAELIYSSPEKKALSDSIIHPIVWKKVRETAFSLSDKGELVLVETALPGPEFADICDHIICFYADSKLRGKRLRNKYRQSCRTLQSVCRRRAGIVTSLLSTGYSDERFNDIINLQPDEEEYAIYADCFIVNDGTKEQLWKRTEQAINDFYKLCKREQR